MSVVAVIIASNSNYRCDNQAAPVKMSIHDSDSNADDFKFGDDNHTEDCSAAIRGQDDEKDNVDYGFENLDVLEYGSK